MSFFRYSTESSWVIKGASLTIPKGARVGFIGQTSAGKSTLLDILMGLLTPCGSAFFVDDQEIAVKNLLSGQSHIARVT